MLAEVSNCESETLKFDGQKLSELERILCAKYPALEDKPFRFAQNNALASTEDDIISEHIALLPPFAGG